MLCMYNWVKIFCNSKSYVIVSFIDVVGSGCKWFWSPLFKPLVILYKQTKGERYVYIYKQMLKTIKEQINK